MSNNKDTTAYLQLLGLSRDEAIIYLELLREPRSHLELSRVTGVNRTKVYRLADNLEKRSLISIQTDDRGTLLTAADPQTLEVEIATEEERLKNQKIAFKKLLPALETLKASSQSPLNFAIQTYEGIDGFKQMLWHELKTKDEILVFGNGSLEDLVVSRRWAEQFRVRAAGAGYTLKELVNPASDKNEKFTNVEEYFQSYQRRALDSSILQLEHQVVVYNDTVATYSWQNDHRVGIEIINKANAEMMRQMFKNYWAIAK